MQFRCLLVDDDRTVVRAAHRYLTQRGHSVETASNAAEARKLTGPFDCIVLDIDLASESGLELAREFVDTKASCILFFSASTNTEVCLAASELGTFVSKAEGLHALSRTMEIAVEESRQAVLVSNGQALVSPRADPRMGSGFRKKR